MQQRPAQEPLFKCTAVFKVRGSFFRVVQCRRRKLPVAGQWSSKGCCGKEKNANESSRTSIFDVHPDFRVPRLLTGVLESMRCVAEALRINRTCCCRDLRPSRTKSQASKQRILSGPLGQCLTPVQRLQRHGKKARWKAEQPMNLCCCWDSCPVCFISTDRLRKLFAVVDQTACVLGIADLQTARKKGAQWGSRDRLCWTAQGIWLKIQMLPWCKVQTLRPQTFGSLRLR